MSGGLPAFQARRKKFGPLYTLSMGVWFTLFFAAPLVIIVLYSFLTKRLHGGVTWIPTLRAYAELANPNILRITAHTFTTAVLATLITIVLALPCGYFMAKSKHQALLLMVIIVPFWTNFLIRVFAWINILGNNGFLNVFLLRLGIVRDYIPFLYNQRAVILVLVYMYLPYAILPLFASIDKFDFSLLEAARDLGATKQGAIMRILFPSIKIGIYTAVLFTFIPIFGAYAVPLLVGGKDSYMLGNVIADQLGKSRNWPLASSISMVLTLTTTIGVLVMLGLQRKTKNEKRKGKNV